MPVAWKSTLKFKINALSPLMPNSGTEMDALYFGLIDRVIDIYGSFSHEHHLKENHVSTKQIDIVS